MAQGHLLAVREAGVPAEGPPGRVLVGFSPGVRRAPFCCGVFLSYKDAHGIMGPPSCPHPGLITPRGPSSTCPPGLGLPRVNLGVQTFSP